MKSSDWGNKKQEYYGDSSQSDYNSDEENEETILDREAEAHDRLKDTTERFVDPSVFESVDDLPDAEPVSLPEPPKDQATSSKKQHDESAAEMAEYLTQLQQSDIFSSPIPKPDGKGLSLLELKTKLMLHYLSYLAYYISLKADGKNTEVHPVCSRLVELRLMLEKMRGVDLNMYSSYQQAINVVEKGSTYEDEAKTGPCLSNLMNSEIEDKLVDDNNNTANHQKPATFKAKKLLPLESTDSLTRKQKKLEREAEIKQAQIIRNSLATLEKDPTAPIREGDNVEDEHDKHNFLESKKRTAFEEDNMFRLPANRALKKQKKKANRKLGVGATLDDLNSWADELISGKDQKKAQKALSDYLNTQEQLSSIKIAHRDATIVKPRKSQKPVYSEKFAPRVEEGNSVEFQKPSKKTFSKRVGDPSKLKLRDPDLEVPLNQKRGINRAIEKNRGLTRKRPKRGGNARLANRLKFSKTSKKVQRFGAASATSSGAYVGESKGLKPNVIRSLKFST